LLMKSTQPAISALVGLEFASVLARKTRMGELLTAAARAAIRKFRDHEESGLFRVLPIDAVHYARARRWIEGLRMPLRTSDALHLAVAAHFGHVLCTADAQLARTARRLRIRRRLLRA